MTNHLTTLPLYRNLVSTEISSNNNKNVLLIVLLYCYSSTVPDGASAPYSPNQNPAERYMEIIVSGARSLLYTSGLPADNFWHPAIEHRAYLQNQMALPG
jgi:hypothetical protein